MFRLFALITAFFTSLPVISQEVSPLVGAWRMEKLEVFIDNKAVQVPYSGQLIVTKEGTLSAQAMDADPNAAPTMFTMNGYEALYGDIEIDDSINQFEVHIQSALVRDLIGKRLKRNFVVNGNEMILSPENPAEGWKVTYTRY